MCQLPVRIAEYLGAAHKLSHVSKSNRKLEYFLSLEANGTWLAHVMTLTMVTRRMQYIVNVPRYAPRFLPNIPAFATKAAPFSPIILTSRTFSATHMPQKKKNKGAVNEKMAEPMDATPQLDLNGTSSEMESVVARCSEHVRTLVGSLGRVDAGTCNLTGAH